MKITSTLAIVFLVFTACNKITPCKLKGTWEVGKRERYFFENYNNDHYDVYDSIQYDKSSGTMKTYNGNYIFHSGELRQYSKYEFKFFGGGEFQIVEEYATSYSGKTNSVTTVSTGSWEILGVNKAENIKKSTRIQMNLIHISKTTKVDSAGMDLGTYFNDYDYTGQNHTTYEVSEIEGRKMILKNSSSEVNLSDPWFPSYHDKYEYIELYKQ